MTLRSYSWLATITLGFVFKSVSAFALPLPKAAESAAPKLAPSEEDIAAAGVDFTAIVALNNCSGSLVRFTTSQSTDAAMVLTNGHCYEGGFLDPDDAIVNVNSSRTFKLLNATGKSSLGTLKATKVIYATMTGTDMTLYRLNTTFAAIEKSYGVKALTLSDHPAEPSTPIRVVSGYWRRIYSCEVDGYVHEIREGDWTFRESLRYSQPGCEIIGGTSGSPVINADTHEIVAVNNTTNEDGEKCTENNPCEVDENGKIVVRRGAGYAQETYWIYSCLGQDNQMDLNREGCKLTKPPRL